MLYLRIENPGVAPVEGFTILGVSTTRNDPIWGPPVKEGRRLTVRIEYDIDAEDPCDNDVFQVYSFSRKFTSFKHPDELGLRSLGFQRKLDCNTAFMLDYFEHGGCAWSIHGEGMQCPWDTSRNAGVLLLNDPKAIRPENRVEQARNFLTVYNNWCNGEVYGYLIQDEDGEHVDSCWGFYSPEDVIEAANEAIGEKDVVVEVKGDCAYLAKYHKIKNLEVSDAEED